MESIEIYNINILLKYVFTPNNIFNTLVDLKK